jgi:hypothetical protein
MKTRAVANEAVLKGQLLKAFLLRCEALGWVLPGARLSWWRCKPARAYWAGVRMTLAHVGNPLAFDTDLDSLTKSGDPFQTAGSLFREVCAAKREGVRA